MITPHRAFRRFIRRAVLIASALAWLPMALPCAAQQNDRVQYALQPVRWQRLPDGITSVCVGPDGRNWIELAPDESKPSEEQLRAALYREFFAPSPQLRSASLALLEPGGRAWFYVKPDELWGFDGQKWIERKATRGSKFSGYCPTRGQLHDNHANRSVAGRAWFRDEHGIHTFDGQDWTYTALCPPVNSENQLPRFSISPNGKFAVAMTPRLPGRTANLTNPDLWLWQSENPVWQRLTVVWGHDKSVFASFCITDEGRLWCTQGASLRILDIAASRDVLARFPEWIGKLNDDDPEVRRQATHTLDAVAELILPRLQAAQPSAASPEVRRRLEAIIQRVTGSKDMPPVIARQQSIGSLQIQAVG